MIKQTPASRGLYYFIQGFKLIQHSRLRPFVIVPLLVNLLLFSVCFYFLFQQIGIWLDELETYLSWFSWLIYILKPLAFILILVIFGFIFGSVANIIAAPFNGLLAEQTELLLSNAENTGMSIKEVIYDIPRIFKREIIKILYYVPRALGLLILFLIPAFGQTVAPILWFLFTAWMITLQYSDYAFDNHKIDFKNMKTQLGSKKTQSLTFGSLIAFAQSIPVLNFIIMPVAVCGATAMWMDKSAD